MPKDYIKQIEVITIYFEGATRNRDDYMVFRNDSIQIIALESE